MVTYPFYGGIILPTAKWIICNTHHKYVNMRLIYVNMLTCNIIIQLVDINMLHINNKKTKLTLHNDRKSIGQVLT